MTDKLSAPIEILLPQASSLSDAVLELEGVLGLIGLTDIEFALPTLEELEDDPLDLIPELSEEEALGELAFFDLGPEVPPPTTPVFNFEALPDVQLDLDSRTLTLDFVSLSEIELNILGSDSAQLLLNQDGFRVEVSYEDEMFRANAALELAVRFSPDLLEPVRRATGSRAIEPDPTRSTVDVALGSIAIQIDAASGLNIQDDLDITITEPLRIVGTDVVIESGQIVLDLRGDEKCIAIQWEESSLGAFANHLSSALVTENGNPVQITARIILGDPINEVFLEWHEETERTLTLPGVNTTIPGNTRYGIVLGNDPNIAPSGINRLAFILTLPGQSMVTAKSTFSWNRNDERELQNEPDNQANTEEPLFRFELTNKQTDSASLVLLSINLQELELPTFLKQLETPIPELALPTPDRTEEQAEQFCTPIGLNAISLRSNEEWETKFDFALDQFELPFLNQPASPNDENGLEQFIRIDKPSGGLSPELDFANQTLSFPINIVLKLGSIELESGVDFGFNWESFALEVNHDDGLKLISKELMLPPDAPADLLGLKWTFKGAETDDGRFHYFTLVTKNFNYQIQQAPGSTIELAYGGLSRDPIIFQVSDFAITDKGLSLRTTVLDAPVRLNGLDTKFRFDGSGIVIENSQIKAFTIAGSGALPPDLVGDSRASIALQFGRREADNNLTLIAGEAKLEGNKLLHCQGSRFQFSVDALGLKFVNDGKFHLYFTITGNAQFVLADGDDADGALALLPRIQIDLIETPLTGDVSVIGKHVKFLVELPKPVSFSFLGCFEMELRGIGFEPQSEVFDGDAAMLISGQLKFAQGGGDVIDARIDFHDLHIGLPEKGSFLPRVHFKGLAVSLAVSDAFKLHAAVDFIEEDNAKGFIGEGMLEIQGLPSMAGSFGFLRVRQDENSPWLRAWFIYVELQKVSFVIPVVQIYLREVGLGFGYRFTLASIKAADQQGDIRKLLQELRTLSRTQGDLSKRDRWAVDLEAPGQDPRWTIVLRAMISQTAASPLLVYSEAAEKELSCTYLFDAVIAFRSDFTFFMAVRGWFNTNYNDFLVDDDGIRSKPLLSGFVLLSPRQKRFLAHVASNPDGKIGRHPPLPDFVKSAIEAAEFSATLLVEPGLLHYEMGWPNMLRWKGKLGPLEVAFQGGFIFRVSKTELVTGASYMARGTLSMEAGFSAGFFGVSISIFAQVAYGARYIGVLAFQNTALNSAFYGAIGLELYIRITIKFWIKLLFVKKTFRFSVGLGLTAALEIALLGNLEPGIRGQGTLSLKAMGRSIRFSVKVAINEGVVNEAIARTSKFLDIGLESTDVEALPGLSPQEPATPRLALAPTAVVPQARDVAPVVQVMADVAGADALNAPAYTLFAIRPSREETYFVLLPAGEKKIGMRDTVEPGFLPVPPERQLAVTLNPSDETELNRLASTNAVITATLLNQINAQLPEGSKLSADAIVRIGKRESDVPSEWLIQEKRGADDSLTGRTVRIRKGDAGFTATTLFEIETDFRANFSHIQDVPPLNLRQFDPTQQTWVARNDHEEVAWRVNWQAAILEPDGDFSNSDHSGDGEPQGGANPQTSISLADYVRGAFIEQPDGTLQDPVVLDEGRNKVEDGRVYNPTDNAFETAVRGAFAQFRGSPLFKYDPNNSYDATLKDAFSNETNIYRASADNDEQMVRQKEHTDQVRGLITHDLISDLQAYVPLAQALEQAQARGANAATIQALQDDVDQFIKTSIAFQMGLVFQVEGQRPPWLDTIATQDGNLPKIGQRQDETANTAADPQLPIRPFNVPLTSFKNNPPRFDRVVHYTNSSTVGITWDLGWDLPPAPGCTACQAEPEHHLMNYEVRRRALDSQERDAVFTVKCGEILHRAQGSDRIEQLRPRFQFVDHFEEQTEAELVRIPERGLSYLYTITPLDFCQDRGRPLTLIATRYPDSPPQVPVNGELTVAYTVSRDETLAERVEAATMPELIEPGDVTIQWSEPRLLADRVLVPIKNYQLVFRRETTLPIGSYGLDSATQRETVTALPTSNARTRPTDIIVPIGLETIQILNDAASLNTPGGIEDTRHDRVALIELETLRGLGVYPQGTDPKWKPEAWRIFFQTLSDGGVPSALAPVQLKLRVQSTEPQRLGFTPYPEERRPAELEWLPNPIQLPLLPPEDQKASTGLAHFPMPTDVVVGAAEQTHMQWQFNASMPNVRFQEHPAGIRAIRFRWNQGPSNQPDYPLNLSAGYELLELDIDAHTNETLTGFKEVRGATRANGSSPAQIPKLVDVLRPIQDVQMLTAADLILTPGNTLTTNQWEAWYPSTPIRLENRRLQQQSDAAIDGTETPYSPWFSWRESALVWPKWDAVESGNRKTLNTQYHPFFTSLIEALQATADPITGAYMVDLQGLPPVQPITFADFRRLTSPSSDPYGWGLLQFFGLSLTFSLREDGSGTLLTGQTLLDAVNVGLEAAKSEHPEIVKHLHVELLFQAGESIMLQEDAAVPEGLLGLIQLSLRPLPIQVLRYTELMVSGPAGAEIELVLENVTNPVTLILQAESSTAIEVEPPDDAATESVVQRITLPVNGKTKILLRADKPFGYTDPTMSPPQPPPATLPPTLYLRYRLKDPNGLLDARHLTSADGTMTYGKLMTIDSRLYLFFAHALATARAEEQNSGERQITKQLVQAFHAVDKPASQFSFVLPEEFEPMSEASTYFLPPVDAILETISNEAATTSSANDDIHTQQWLRFKQYAESLNSSGRESVATADEPTIEVPTTKEGLRKDNLLAQFLSWTQRFMDHSSPIKSAKATNLNGRPLMSAQADGPWLATAYPRAGTPAYATPDDVGRLEYFHLLEDKWAHNYRYYVRPTNRYQQLWRNLYLSTLLWPPEDAVNQTAIVPVLPKLENGGLDVVVDRTKPVSIPTILRSGRLDRLSPPGQPTAPGKIWEVIIAQHREQALSARNQTVYRQLSFRHVAYTLLRRFAFEAEWSRWSEDATIEYPFTPEYSVNQQADLPKTLEPQFYNLDDPRGLTEDDEVRFALPQRLDTFQQGALVIQWESLPFYYAHRMLVIAQTATQVSPVNSVIQQDFEYRAPEPADEPTLGTFSANFLDGTDEAALRTIQIPLRRLWDSLPPTVQARWPDENPDVTSEEPGDGSDNTDPRPRRPGILPDPEVVYQIVEFFQGNTEVQAEIDLEVQAENTEDAMLMPIAYSIRQLGKRQEVIDEPIVIRLTDESYALSIGLKQIDEASILSWRNEGLISNELDLPPEGFTQHKLDNIRLLWPGRMSTELAEVIENEIPGDARFQQALNRLATAAQVITEPPTPTEIVVSEESVPLALDELPSQGPTGTTYQDLRLSGLPEGAVLEIIDGPEPGQEPPVVEPTAQGKTHYVALGWTGPLFADQETGLLTTLQDFFQLTEIRAALPQLFDQLSQQVVSVLYTGELDDTVIPESLTPQLQIVLLEDETKTLQFTGLLINNDQLTALTDLPGQIEEPEAAFGTAVDQLIALLKTTTTVEPLNIPKRPTQDTLPESVRESLMMGRSRLVFDGILSKEKAKIAADSFERLVDKKAVERLYYRSVLANLSGRILQIRTRRGSAEPSPRRTLEPMIVDFSATTPAAGEGE